MSRKGKWAMYMLFVLIIISVHNDLSQGKQPSSPTEKSHVTEEKILVVKRTISRGDTLLSIMEEIHANNGFTWKIDQVVRDFKVINDGQDPYQLTEQQTYYFPLYMY